MEAVIVVAAAAAAGGAVAVVVVVVATAVILADMVKATSCQATAILLWKCIKEKSSMQMLLNCGLDVSEYVTKVMKRLNHPNPSLIPPKVVLKFLEHFAS